MKIYNKEDDIEKMYIQVDDLSMLVLEKDIPKSISDMICEVSFNDKYNKDDFICFKKKREIEFLKSISWIVDIREYRDKQIGDIKKEIKRINDKLSHLYVSKSKINDAILDFKELKLREFIQYKKGERNLNLPLESDYDGFSFTSKDKKYVIKPSLNPNVLVLSRIDGKKLNKYEGLSTNFIELGTAVAISKKIENGERVGKYTITYEYSNDMKYYIINIICNIDKNKEVEEKGIKKLIKKFMGKKKELI